MKGVPRKCGREASPFTNTMGREIRPTNLPDQLPVVERTSHRQ